MSVGPEATSSIRTFGRFAASWSEDQLRGAVGQHRQPCPAVLIELERFLHATRTNVAPTHYVLELGGRRFGAMAALRDSAPARGPAQAPDGSPLTTMGTLARGAALRVAADGRLFAQEGGKIRQLAEHVHNYLERIAHETSAMGARWLHLRLSDRAKAAEVALRLGLDLDAASDACSHLWRSEDALLYEGEIDEPSASSWHALAAATRAGALLGALAHMAEAAELWPHPKEELRSPADAPRASRPAVAIDHRSRRGWVGWRDPNVEQAEVGEGGLVSLVEWPSGSARAFVRAGTLRGLSARGNERLLARPIERDPRRTAPLDELRACLDRERLPWSPLVEAIERELGGVGWSLRDGGARIGFATFGLLNDETRRFEHASFAADSEVLERGDDWPRVLLDGAPLVPVAEQLDTTVYATADAQLVEHDWLRDEVRPAARDAWVLLERWLLVLDVNERVTTGRAHDLAGDADVDRLVAALGLPRFEEASDHVVRCWEDASGTVLFQFGPPSQRVRLVATDARVIDAARAFFR